MNFLDIILICIVTLFLVRGFFRGLVQEVLSLIAIVLATFLAANFDDLVAPHLQLYIDNMTTVSVLSYSLIFFGTLIIFWILAKVIRSMLEISLLGWVDRTAGGFFGLAEGVLICLMVLMFLQTFAPKAEILKESFLAPQAQHLVDALDEYIDLPSATDAFKTAKDALGIKNDTTN
ncbi:CvpA family protein [Pseudodesulfovibrio sediminis]|uniref:Colicin V biosynthesis protein n=1 Tax=Pseudodesulfovibrio sediminis TaxID=2810563 RepID=A0ABN6ENM7_9BACT|nr:CvpA family protein [Pseudodesulfovibrio sediminis]BCS86869.1 colicin V biosynthesis protein [Pseudodesulfovibrio sediminis]